MTLTPALAALPTTQRRDFCRQVLETLPELLDGSAPPAWRARVAELLGASNDFRALCDTLKEVEALARECGAEAAAAIDGRLLDRVVRRVRAQLEREPPAGA